MLYSKIIIIISIFFFCIFVILFLKVRIKIDDFIFASNKVRYRIILEVYLLGIIKILKLYIYEDYIKIGFIKHKYDVKKFKNIKFDKSNLKNILGIVIKTNLDELDILVEIGNKNIFVNVYIIPIISFIISYIGAKKFKLVKHENLNYKIISKYDQNLLNIKFKLCISMYFIKLLYYLRKKE